MPSDILGTEVIEEDVATGKRHVRFIPGPVFANIILADEINRTPPRTQAALLEAMQEYQVTVGGVRYPLERPLFVLATENPIEQEGTYPLPEAQLDRFMFNVVIDYPRRWMTSGAFSPRRRRARDRCRAARRDGRGARSGAHARARTAGRRQRGRLRAAADSRNASRRRDRAAPVQASGCDGAWVRARARRWCSAPRRRRCSTAARCPSPDDVTRVALPGAAPPPARELPGGSRRHHAGRRDRQVARGRATVTVRPSSRHVSAVARGRCGDRRSRTRGATRRRRAAHWRPPQPVPRISAPSFAQHRPYRAGDDLKYLDWKLFARSDRLYTRQFRETTNLVGHARARHERVDGVSRTGRVEVSLRPASSPPRSRTSSSEQGNAVGLMTMEQGRLVLRARARRTSAPARR